MSSEPPDPRWPRLMGLAVHECRTPLTVVAGYIRMLLTDRAGPLTDQQRHVLQLAESSCGRLTSVLAEMSDLAQLESQTATFNRSPLALAPLLSDVVATLPPQIDRDVTASLDIADATPMIVADAVRLRTAFTSILVALRRETATSAELPIRLVTGEHEGRPVSWIAFGDGAPAPDDFMPGDRATFDEWRGGTGLSLAVARSVITAHAGAIWGPRPGAGPGALVMLPHA